MALGACAGRAQLRGDFAAQLEVAPYPILTAASPIGSACRSLPSMPDLWTARFVDGPGLIPHQHRVAFCAVLERRERTLHAGRRRLLMADSAVLAVVDVFHCELRTHFLLEDLVVATVALDAGRSVRVVTEEGAVALRLGFDDPDDVRGFRLFTALLGRLSIVAG